MGYKQARAACHAAFMGASTSAAAVPLCVAHRPRQVDCWSCVTCIVLLQDGRAVFTKVCCCNHQPTAPPSFRLACCTAGAEALAQWFPELCNQLHRWALGSRVWLQKLLGCCLRGGRAWHDIPPSSATAASLVPLSCRQSFSRFPAHRALATLLPLMQWCLSSPASPGCMGLALRMAGLSR